MSNVKDFNVDSEAFLDTNRAAAAFSEVRDKMCCSETQTVSEKRTKFDK